MPDSHSSGSGRMEGHGFYTEHSQAQEAYGELGFEWLEQAAAEVDPPTPPLPFVIADLGSAGGGNSLGPMRRALAARQGDGPALVVHTDIPGNDFTSLFELVASSPQTYLGSEDVFAGAEGRSFYEPLFPPGFLSLGWSSIAVHWLSRVPRPIPDHIYCSFAQGDVREALREQSAADWRAFLSHCARELRPGGRLVVVGGAALDDGSSGAEGLMEMANSALQELITAGELAEAEYVAMTIPTWNRTSAEFLAPFEAGEVAGLELTRHTIRSLPDAYYAAYRQDQDLDAYAANVAGFFRAAFEDSLWSALDPGRPDAKALESRFDELLRERISTDPSSAACEWHVVVLDITRVNV